MRPLERNRRVLTWLCLYPPNDDTSTVMKWIYPIAPFAFFIVDLTAIIASALFFWKFRSTDIGKALNGCWQIAGFALTIYQFTVMYLSRHNIKQALDALSDIYNSSTMGSKFEFNR